MLNMNMADRVVIETELQEWVPSPIPGVWRKPLERANAESGHATSLVKYAPGSKFTAHTHLGGEEIYVLDGVFSDETGDYPAGSYLRNPPGSQHSPFSLNGCTIFVKLHQFQAGDLTFVRVNSHNALWSMSQGNLAVLPLHQFTQEQTAVVRWPAGEVYKRHQHRGGEEILVLHGTFKDGHGIYPALTWLRNPQMGVHEPNNNEPIAFEDTLILVKTGHLPSI